MSTTTKAAIYAMPTSQRSLTVITVREWRTPPSTTWSLDVQHADPDRSPIQITTWHTTGPVSASRARNLFGGDDEPLPEVTYAKTVIDGLQPGTEYRIRLMEQDRVINHCRGTTQPSGEEAHATLVFASCHGIPAEEHLRETRAQFLSAAYDELAVNAGPGPTYNAWLGDQVYLDEPWKEGFVFTADFHRRILDRYRETLGLNRDASGFMALLSKGSNTFIPDDHEFWNNYPRMSFVTLPFHTASRGMRQLGRFVFRPDEPHPYFHGGWGRTAGAAYMAFQSDEPTPFTEFSKDVSPTAVQTIELAGARVVLVDTRWHRTLRLKDPKRNARFLTETDFDLLRQALETDKLVVLGLAKPIIGALAADGSFNEGLEIGPENYRRQYLEFWALLNRRAQSGLPTAVVAGDVHHHSVCTALGDRLVEFVCSPMSMFDAGNTDTSDSTEQPKRRMLGFLPARQSNLGGRIVTKALRGAKIGKAVLSRVGNNGQALLKRQRPRSFNPKKDRHHGHHLFVDDKPQVDYGSQLYPIPHDDKGSFTKNDRSGLAALDISCPPGGPVTLTYRAVFDQPIVPGGERRLSMKLEWTDGGGWQRLEAPDADHGDGSDVAA